MSVQIRPFTPADYPAIAAIRGKVWPDNPVLAETLEHNDNLMKPGLVRRRFIAEQGGQAVGSALFFHMEWVHHPQKFMVGVSVLPEKQGQGIGSALYQRLMSELEAFNPIKLLSDTREDKTQALRFANKRGFVEDFRTWESRLDLATFEPERWSSSLERLAAQGYQIQTFAQLQADPQREAKMYQLDLEGSQDVPLPPGESFTFPEQARYWETTYANPDYDPHLWFLAVKDGEYVGVSMLYKRPVDNDFNTGFTTVKRTHRHKGIGLALKVAALSHAKALGKRAVRTDNAQTNRPMLAINEALGFEKMPAWIGLAKTLQPEE